MNALVVLGLLGGGLYLVNRKLMDESDTIGSPLEDSTDVVDTFTNQAQKVSMVDGKQKIILIGDSLAVGLAKYGLGDRAAVGQYPFAAHAAGGTRAADWAPRIAGILAKEGLDNNPGIVRENALVLVSLGTNDSGPDWQGNRQPAVGQAMQDINKVVRGEYKADLIWIGMPTLPYAKLPNQDRIRSLTMQLQPDFIDSSKMTIEKSSDQIHPTPKGYDDWSAQIWTDLQRRGQVK
jgi:lysophospholipase L1-like esterase